MEEGEDEEYQSSSQIEAFQSVQHPVSCEQLIAASGCSNILQQRSGATTTKGDAEAGGVGGGNHLAAAAQNQQASDESGESGDSEIVVAEEADADMDD